eukprot:CAMPEP_0201112538 /NCGR_PEP_ID=MMETSP0812-20130820/77316_1 /ASSEMBLY_ACC=CAM_ASM_000668 /TAXON_ID=98059 /ORGANISM="Dinobryon sp., Strain UTEXLB2267" /LENGTH=307 /DNA_ID=CAMNT_0047375911 /DNA_START=60 /DNA_END=983 /DNA_ORIENTATION=+
MACEHWGTLLTLLTFTTYGSSANKLNAFQDAHAYEDIEQRLADNLHPVFVLQEVSSSITCDRNPIFVEYCWVLNLDKASLIMSQPIYSIDIELEWSFKSLYLMLQVLDLVKSKNGDIRMACEHWGTLLTLLTFTTYGSSANKLNAFEDAHAFEDIEQRLADNLHPVFVLQEVSSSITCYLNPIYVEYCWVLNLDKASLIMSQPIYSIDIELEWSFKSLYLMLQVQNKYYLDKLWVSEAKSLHSYKFNMKFRLEYLVLLAQRQIRRFLAMRKALEPENGMLYKLAKRKKSYKTHPHVRECVRMNINIH